MGTQQRTTNTRLAAGLGWFSIGLGLAELTAPEGVAKLIGLGADDRTRGILRAYGAREVATGVAILSSGSDDAGLLWARVAGDVLDLASLGAAMRRSDASAGKLAFGIASVAGVMAADVIAARGLGRRGNGYAVRAHHERGVRVSKTFTINKPPDEVYRFWRQLDNLPTFMRHLERVDVKDARQSHWVARGPAGSRVEWDAEMIEDSPQRIAWRSLEGADVRHSGAVEFRPAPGGRGTELRVRLQYEPPAGRVGKWIARAFGEEPQQQISEDLRRFKMLIETGEIARSAGSSSVFQPGQPAREPVAAGGRR
jgi:uncharacterized membrane protein